MLSKQIRPLDLPPLLPINIHQDHRLPYAYASPLTDPVKTTGSASGRPRPDHQHHLSSSSPSDLSLLSSSSPSDLKNEINKESLPIAALTPIVGSVSDCNLQPRSISSRLHVFRRVTIDCSSEIIKKPQRS
ncbi:hypothetical protein L2E82_24908 [Cichorium intybus]|uniref:Uncharacterized protein n=1 Tax=Cichorium intybus TaxID=13427 RepID=A0ACB9E2S4_CICIN|nr:hypothetical protein L2E82_24908 [Cichorium intybus]